MSIPARSARVTQGTNILGIPYKADVKSFVSYPIKAFEAKGYAVATTTWDELIALSDKIVADERDPWCRTRPGAGGATSSQLTDWVEEVVLDRGLAYYDDSITGGVTFRAGHRGRL